MPYLPRLAGRYSRALLTSVSALFLAVVARATIGSSLQTQLGNPSSATADPSNHGHYLIQRDQYGMDYADATREPNWVSWDLTTADVGSSGRSSFIQDTTLPAGFYQVLTTDYSGSGYDRGHLCPSADRTVTVADNQQVFYMSNMMPQTPDNNQGVWASFETYCRSLASGGNEVLITCGPSGFGGSTIASGVAIPGYTWKVAVVVPLGSGSAVSRITSSTRVIAIKIPNIAGVRNTPWQNFITSVAQIESDTGFTFFGALPASVANALRVQVDGQSAAGAPAIVAQPGNQTTVVGGTATFAVTASGDDPLTYQWLKDDTEIAGATNASLTVSPVAASDAGTYNVVVTNAVGSVTSNDAQLVINGLPPTITTSPAPQTVNAGSTVTLAVSVSGSPTFAYQWRKDSFSVTGATNATLTLTNVQAGDAGSYDVVVTNSVSSATSDAALLTVNAALPSFATQPAAQTSSVGGNASFSVVAVGTNPLSYQWRKSGVPLTDGGAVSGATSPTLGLTGISAVDGATYDVVVTNALGSATSNAVLLTVTAPPPATIYWNCNTAAPASNGVAGVTASDVTQNNNNGTTTMLTASSVSSGYTGSSGGNNAGAAARTGALTTGPGGSAWFEFTLTPPGGKRLVVSGLSFGMRSTSTGPQAYALYSSVDGFSAPVATGNVSNSGSWALKTAAMSTVTGATDAPVTFRLFGYNGAGSASANTANWRIDDLTVTASTVFPPPVAPVVLATTPASGATGVDVTAPITVTFNEAVSFTGSWFTISSANHGSTAATVTGGPTTYTLNPPSNFAYSDTITVTVLGAQVVDQATGTIHGTTNSAFTFTTGVYVPPTPPTVTSNPTPVSVNVGDAASFTVAASGTAPFQYQWRRNGNAIAGNPSATSATLLLTAVSTADGASYDCVVSNVAGSDISAPATLTVTVVPPTVTTQPTARSVGYGGTATFTVAASGTAPFSYQWRHNGLPLADGGAVSGATSATLTITGATVPDDGTYDVVVTNAASSATSAGAFLAVVDAVGVISWDFATAAPTAGIPADVSGGSVAQGNNNGTTTLLTTTSASGSYAGASGGNNAGAAARTGTFNPVTSAYFEFTFTPLAGRQFAATALAFGLRSTGTGPQAFALYTSADGYVAPIATGTVPNDSAWHAYAPSVRGVVGTEGAPVTFRLFGYNGTGSPGAGTANWRIDDVKLTAGLLALPPTAPVVSSTLPENGAANVALDAPISVTFDQAVTVSGSWLAVNGSASGPMTGTISGGPTTFTFTPATTFGYGETITLSVNAANVVEARTGTLAMAANAMVAFTTIPPTPPSFTTQPESQTVTVGDTVTWTAAATGTAPLSFQWRRNGAAIAGATEATLVLESVTTAAAGDYDVVATNQAASVASSVATLGVHKAPATVTLAQLSATYDGGAHPVVATTSPGGLPVVVTYNGAAIAPVNAGAYSVVATVAHADYEGSAASTLIISPAHATVTLAGLTQVYDGLPKVVSVSTVPENLPVSVTYDGASSAPTNPGTYAVVATVTDPNYTASAADDLTVTITSVVRHGPTLNGGFDGSMQVLSAEAITLNGNAWMSGDLLVPGTPTLRLNGHPTVAGTLDGTGSATPNGYFVTLNGNAVLRYLVRRTDALTVPAVPEPASPTGRRNVTLNRADEHVQDFSVVRNLTLNGNVGLVAVPSGSYGAFVANGGAGFVLGLPHATEPAIYNLQSLTLNGGARLAVVGPVVVHLAQGVTLNGAVGDAAHPEWLTLRVTRGDVTLNGGATLHGAVVAPASAVHVNGRLHGTVISDRLDVNGSGLVDQP